MTTTISDADERRINLAVTQLAAVEGLHQRHTEEVMAWECANADCEHEDECPTAEVFVCSHCFGLAVDTDHDEQMVPSDVYWPCATAKAFGAVA
jgi:hypothetical protein